MSTLLYVEHTQLLKQAGITIDCFDSTTITENDVLLIIDCQNDFFPADSVEDGGRFGVADGDKIVPSVLRLIDLFADKKCPIVATKDCHSTHHCSFTPNGGSFPPHCIQGTKGYDFHKEIGSKLLKIKNDGASVYVGFKGIEDNHECFSAFLYTENTGKERFGPEFQPSEWCDCYILNASTLDHNIDSQPDALSVIYKSSISEKLHEQLSHHNCRIFICGLAFDFCVVDSAINAKAITGKPVYVIHDATRAAHISGVGSFGSGFLSDPAEMAKKFTTHCISVVDLN